MRKNATVRRLGVAVKNLGSCETRNGIAWSAEVTMPGGETFRVSNDGNGGCDDWYRKNTDGHLFAGVDEAQAALAVLARKEPALRGYADCMSADDIAASMWIGGLLDGAFLIETVR